MPLCMCMTVSTHVCSGKMVQDHHTRKSILVDYANCNVIADACLADPTTRSQWCIEKAWLVSCNEHCKCSTEQAYIAALWFSLAKSRVNTSNYYTIILYRIIHSSSIWYDTYLLTHAWNNVNHSYVFFLCWCCPLLLPRSLTGKAWRGVRCGLCATWCPCRQTRCLQTR